MQFLFDISGFVVDHCIVHPIASIAAKIMEHPAIQDVIAKAVVLGEKRLRLQDKKRIRFADLHTSIGPELEQPRANPDYMMVVPATSTDDDDDGKEEEA